ncbi:histidinol dehydrogenase [Rhodoplanes sp. TEM]|uniref:Histidinol dehydrogenase n=1 Tax=Rhodoplanes tepidamans TaxID=200616 RepID=A0ABT5JI27_RHOTP|nr:MULTISPECIES: histidinol dehydrogenase [Rhodoplanes]MDC7789158.1 histidinol dehydrogenase [Rhodoplanes tepidamans]MDC7987190.1 histidinol dehydrogenase [Rhodoplanes sp. TEM]MDQ0358528.1 histidinol dehydrogenase [Rhodoplanes tepidamans]
MPVRLDTRDPDFDSRFAALLGAKREAAADVEAAVRAIVDDVRARGDAALVELTEKFDRLELPAGAAGLRVTADEIAAAVAACPPEDVAALTLARDRIEAYHRRQIPADQRFTDALGVELGYRWTPVEAAGLYVPGGTAAYPSSVLMNAVPAKVAGVARLVMVVPAPGGRLAPLVLAAAHLAGVDEIYRVGGAQAVAALAWGTQTIAPVDKIVGPGNAYVAAAKRIVFGKVGIDMIAGPSEVLIVADGTANPEWIAADLLAQAEHDTAAQSILITTDAALAAAVEKAVESQLATLPRETIAGASWRDHGAVILVETLDRAVALADAVAAEHLELAVADPEPLAARIRHAGAIFVGAHTPEAIGDYVAGSNHVLPTARSARFSSGLGVLDFMKRTSLLRCGPDQLAALGPAAVTLARAEGLEAHARSVALRLASTAGAS